MWERACEGGARRAVAQRHLARHARIGDRTLARDRAVGDPAARRHRVAASLHLLEAPARAQSRAWWRGPRSEEHTSELQSLMRISYAVFCLKKKKIITSHQTPNCNNRQCMAHNNQ